MEHVTSDRRDSTSPSSLLHSLFFIFSSVVFSPHPYFFPSCIIFLFSPLTCPAHSQLSTPSLLFAFDPIKTSMHTVIYLCLPCDIPSLCLLSLLLHVFLLCGAASLKPQPPFPPSVFLTHQYAPMVCAFPLFILSSIPSSASLPLAVTPFPLGLPLSLLLPPP